MGSTAVFFDCIDLGLTGPVFDYSETWQLIINTGTTIVTFLIQKAQNKNSLALQIKRNGINSLKLSQNSAHQNGLLLRLPKLNPGL
ncbi:low affinity iron permease family protein [Flavobacterium sp. HJJ]|nr:low affinity iron permease family protein [Flavobacterium sp. HJJ]